MERRNHRGTERRSEFWKKIFFLGIFAQNWLRTGYKIPKYDHRTTLKLDFGIERRSTFLEERILELERPFFSKRFMLCKCILGKLKHWFSHLKVFPTLGKDPDVAAKLAGLLARETERRLAESLQESLSCYPTTTATSDEQQYARFSSFYYLILSMTSMPNARGCATN